MLTIHNFIEKQFNESKMIRLTEKNVVLEIGYEPLSDYPLEKKYICTYFDKNGQITGKQYFNLLKHVFELLRENYKEIKAITY